MSFPLRISFVAKGLGFFKQKICVKPRLLYVYSTQYQLFKELENQSDIQVI